MTEPNWIPQEAILAVHDELLVRFGGVGGIRDEGLLLSALERPKQQHYYNNRNIHELAAIYAEGIVMNHPFLDGNKRTGFMAAYIFLGINGYDLVASEEEAVIETLALAASATKADHYAEWLKANCVKKNKRVQ